MRPARPNHWDTAQQGEVEWMLGDPPVFPITAFTLGRNKVLDATQSPSTDAYFNKACGM